MILNYNGGERVLACIHSVLKQSYDDYEVLIVDNASTDGSPELIRGEFPGIRMITNPRNLGYAGGNNVGIGHTSSEYVVFLNQDADVDGDWLARLIEPLDRDERVALSTSKILMSSDRSKINTCGNVLHFTGFAFCRRLGEADDRPSEPELVGGVSGCSFAARRSVFEELGRFDPAFFAYLEDADLSWSALLAGFRIAYAHASVVYHDYSPKMTPFKYFLLERNRYLVLMKHFRLSTLLAILPALLLAEVLSWSYAVKRGFVREKIGTYAWVLRNLGKVRRKRAFIQGLRRVPDSELLSELSYEIPVEVARRTLRLGTASATAIRAFNALFKLSYELARRLVR